MKQPLERERRVQIQDKPLGYLGSVLVGLAFGAGWTPCIGPILGSILLFTSTQSNLRQGIVLLLAYSIGLAIPFLVAAFAVQRFVAWFRRYKRFIPLVTRLSGALLVAVGLLVATGYFALLQVWLQGLTPAVLRSRL